MSISCLGSKMRIMVFTDTIFAGTGFSEEARHVMFRLAQMGHEIFWIGMHMGFPVDIPDTMFPDIPHKDSKIKLLGYFGDRKSFGASAVLRYSDTYCPDLVWVLGDPQNIAPYIQVKRLGFPILFYVTLDGLPISPTWRQLFDIPDINVAITEWAMNEYIKKGFPMHAFIHHGVNWNFWQVSDIDKQHIKKKYGLHKHTVFISWDVNQYRKRTDALLRCWRDFKPETKNAKLVLFTDWDCPIGFNIDEKIEQYDVPRETIISPKQLIGRDKIWECAEEPWLIKEIASLGDIYISTTGGEGFGKTLLEAMTIGMPVIATKTSAVVEVLDKYGILIDPYEGQAGRYALHSSARSCELTVVNEQKFVEAMNYLYQNPNERKEIGEKAREWAKEFDYDTKIMNGWDKILNSFDPNVLMAHKLLAL